MSDIINELRFYAAKKNWPRGLEPLSILLSGAADLLYESEKREKEARDREDELVGMIAAADESRLLQIRRADAARNVALDDAANVVAAVSHEGLHNSMWRNRFESVAASIRSMKSEDS
ncbi:hypothetical protein PCC82_04570 [Agrobacterium deltaense]